MTKAPEHRRKTRLSIPISIKEKETLDTLRGDLPLSIYVRSLIRQEEALQRVQTTGQHEMQEAAQRVVAATGRSGV